MTIQILMPALSPTMTEGNIAKWHKKEGDEVASGDLLAEIETDKATMELEAVDDGVLGKIIAAEGSENIAVNTPIAVMLEEGEDASAAEAAASAAPAPSAAAAPEPAPAAEPAPAQQPAPAAPKSNGARAFASPLAKRMAADAGMDIGAISGSGPHGRVVKRDVEAAIAGGVAAPAAAPSAAPPAPAAPAPAQLPVVAGGYTEVPHNNMRKTIARRLQESKQTVPHFYVTMECEIDKLLAMRKDLNARAEATGEDYKISVNDFIIRAAAFAMKKVPDVNASWTDEAMLLYNDIDISVAVAIDGGLITPIVRNADQKGLAVISNEMKDLAARAREGKLGPDEFQGGGFTISNLGMYGVKEFAAIINPPQSCILAVGAGEQRPVVRDGALTTATMMSVTLVDRSPGGRRRAGRRMASGLQGPHRGPAGHAAVGGRDGGSAKRNELRRHRRRRRAGRLRDRHPRRAARHEGGLRGAGTFGRHLPQLGLHPDQGAAAHLRGLSPDGAGRRVRPQGRGRLLRYGEDRQAVPPSVARRLSGGVAHLLKKNKVAVFDGHGKLAGQEKGVRKLEVSADGKKIADLTAKHIILATGARARTLPGLEPDGELIWTYKEAMVPEEMPKSLLVVGSGAIGIEFASFYKTLGAEVTVVEVLPRILPVEDEEISGFAEKAFKAQGMNIMTSATVKGLKKGKGNVTATIEADGKSQDLTVDRVILAVGIVGNVEDIGLEGTKVQVEKSHIVIDEWSATHEPGVYAIGDVTGPPWLAHKASHEGIICVEKIACVNDVHPLDTSRIPGCTYCAPQVASVGLTEAAARERAMRSRSANFRSRATARPLRWASRTDWSRPCSTPRPASCWARTWWAPR